MILRQFISEKEIEYLLEVKNQLIDGRSRTRALKQKRNCHRSSSKNIFSAGNLQPVYQTSTRSAERIQNTEYKLNSLLNYYQTDSRQKKMAIHVVRRFLFLWLIIVDQFFPFSLALLYFPGKLFQSSPPCEQTHYSALREASIINDIKARDISSNGFIISSNRLPWSSSMLDSRKLSYMPMLDFQLQLMKNLGMEEVALEENLNCKESEVKKARIGNMCFKNSAFRKVRCTYFDAGDAVQVYNTLWYPSYEYDLPLFGVDLISLGKNRVLSVIDFQPLYPTEEYHAKYIQQLTSTRMQYSELHGTLSGKIYDDTSFFSKNMLFGRFKDESQVDSVVLPAFKDYLEKYLELMASSVPNHSEESMAAVKQRQQEYDQYSALKDPAVGLFEAYFGKQWSDSFVHDFLFSLCRDSAAASAPLVPVHQYEVDNITGAVTPMKLKH